MKDNKNTKNTKKNTKGNILIIASVIFVTLAVVVFVIALSLYNGNNDKKNESSSAEGSSSGQISSSSQPASSSSIPASSSSIPASSSTQPASSSSNPASSSSQPASSSGSSIEISQAQKVVENARLLLKTPFKDGGSGPDGFDSSGFVYYVMRESGFITCPRNIVEQSKMGVPRGFDELKPGDVLFFSNEVGGEPNFAGFYSGGGKMIGCLITSTFEGVSEVNINNDYYRRHFVAGVGIS